MQHLPSIRKDHLFEIWERACLSRRVCLLCTSMPAVLTIINYFFFLLHPSVTSSYSSTTTQYASTLGEESRLFLNYTSKPEVLWLFWCFIFPWWISNYSEKVNSQHCEQAGIFHLRVSEYNLQQNTEITNTNYVLVNWIFCFQAMVILLVFTVLNCFQYSEQCMLIFLC